jgi:hypothetical protein
MTDVQVQAAAEPRPMSFPARIVGIFTAPSRVFEELKRRPTWLAPVLLVALVSAAFNGIVLWSKSGEAAFREQFVEAMEKRGQGVAPEILERQITITRYAGPLGYLLFTPIVLFVSAGLVYLIFSIGLGGEGTFKQTFAAYCHVGVIGLVREAVRDGLILLKGSMKFSTSVTAFLPFLDDNSFAYKLCQGLDLFVLWQFAVLSIGMGIINDLSTKKAAAAIFSVYLIIWLIIAVIWQALS